MMGNVVEEFKKGETMYRICDDFCRDVTERDAAEILKSIAREVYPELLSQCELTA